MPDGDRLKASEESIAVLGGDSRTASADAWQERLAQANGSGGEQRC